MLRTPAPAESQTVASAGRTVAFGVYGHSSGAPVVLFPGTPGSRFAGRMCQDWAEDAGCRLIVPDRPGFGGSPFQPGRRLVDHAGDVAAICEHLGIKQFAALGISGGTPFVLACASLMPERVTAGAIVSGFFGLDTLVDPSAYAEEQRDDTGVV